MRTHRQVTAGAAQRQWGSAGAGEAVLEGERGWRCARLRAAPRLPTASAAQRSSPPRHPPPSAASPGLQAAHLAFLDTFWQISKVFAAPGALAEVTHCRQAGKPGGGRGVSKEGPGRGAAARGRCCTALRRAALLLAPAGEQGPASVEVYRWWASRARVGRVGTRAARACEAEQPAPRRPSQPPRPTLLPRPLRAPGASRKKPSHHRLVRMAAPKRGGTAAHARPRRKLRLCGAAPHTHHAGRTAALARGAP